MNLRLVVADDHQMIREALCSLLAGQPDMDVVGEASDGLQAVNIAKKLKPDVVVMDITMPVVDGIEATRQLSMELPQIKTIALSMHSDQAFVYKMLRAGARGYLLKSAAFDKLVEAIRTVIKGEVYLSPSIAQTMIGDTVSKLAGESPADKHDLTNRESEVLRLIADGKSTREAANHLCLGVKTIETHRRRIMGKLDLHSVAQLTKYAVREGLSSV